MQTFKRNLEYISTGIVVTDAGAKEHHTTADNAIIDPVGEAVKAALKNAKPGDNYDVTVIVAKKNRK